MHETLRAYIDFIYHTHVRTCFIGIRTRVKFKGLQTTVTDVIRVTRSNVKYTRTPPGEVYSITFGIMYYYLFVLLKKQKNPAIAVIILC